MEKKSYRKYMDGLNILATFGVVVLHCNGRGCFWTYADTPSWRLSVFPETLFYWAVPVFFMLTGANLINYREKYDTRTYFLKRIKRTLLPFLFWSLFSIVYYRWDPTVALRPLEIHSLMDAIDVIFNCIGNNVYWFFIPLFAVYLAIPVLGGVPKDRRKRIFLYMVLLAFVTISLLPLFCSLCQIRFNSQIMSPVSGGYLIYVLVGYLLVYCCRFDRYQRGVIYALGLCGWWVRYYTLVKWSVRDGAANGTFGGYTNLPTVLFSVAVFVFFQYEVSEWRIFKRLSGKLLRRLAQASFGVYLLHMYLISIWWQGSGGNTKNLVWRLLSAVVVYFIAAILTMLVQLAHEVVKRRIE